VLIVEDDKDDGGRAELPGFAFDERERAVLERTSAVTLSVKVASFFYFEGPFVSYGLRESLAEHEQMLLVLQSLGDSLALLARLESHADANRQAGERISELREGKEKIAGGVSRA
jgi:hypothetical protein